MPGNVGQKAYAFLHHPSLVAVFLVEKSDNSWHFCVDYHSLNARTIKDKFHNPLTDELLD